jgi:S1-C subfamily serine protease
VKNLVRPLDILAVELTLELAKALPDLRIPTGLIVAARTLGTRTGEIPLQTGDVIHGLNGEPVTTLEGLRAALTKLKPGGPVALQIERHEQIFYVSFTR